MAEEIGHAYLAILPSAKGFTPALAKQITPGVSKAGEASGRRFGDTFTKATIGPLRAFGGLAAGIFAVDKVAEFFKSSIAEARESQKVSALTAQVIKSTGGAAGVSAKQVGDLATAISNKVGVDDEAIQSGENLLLTFTNIRNEAGKGNDVFNRATRTITDMSAALGQDLKASAIQVGKALNDPVKGVTALQRVGVTFDAQQKKQIATLVNSGKTLQAQKLILHELGREFGGAAAASATAGEKLKVAFDNAKESVGKALLPLLDRTESALVDKVLPALGQGASAAGRFFTALRSNRTIQATIASLGDGFGAVAGAVKNAAVVLEPFAKDLALIGGAAVVGSVRALSVVFDGLAKATEAVTGFFARNSYAAAALAGVITATLIPSIAGTTIALGRMIALNAGAALFILRGAVAAAGAAFVTAGGGVAGFAAALQALNLNPVMLAITAVVAASAVMIHAFNGQMHAAQAAGRAIADDYIRTLDLSNTSVKTITGNVNALELQMVKTVKSGGGIGQLSGKLSELTKAAAAQIAAGKDAAANQTSLAQTYGVSTRAVARLASANGIDLSGSYDTVAAKVAQVIGPTKTLTADTKVMGTAAAGSAAQVNALSDAVSKLLGNFVGVKQAELEFDTDLKELSKDLKKSHGSLNDNTKAGAAARAQYLTTAGAIGTVANAMAKNGASTDAVRRKIRDMLGAFKDTPAGGKLVTSTLDHIRHLAGTLDLHGAGSKATGTFAAGVGANKGKAAGAAKGVLGAVKSAFGRPGDVGSEGVSLVQGFAAGMQSNNALVAVASAAAVVITAAINALHHHGKGGSPYKRFMPEGRWAAEGFAVGMSSAHAPISKAAASVVNRSLKTLGQLQKSVTSFAEKIASKSQAKQFENNWTHSINVLSKSLDTLKTHIQAVRSARADLSSSISGGLISGASTANAPSQNLTATLSFKRIQARQIKTFRRDLGILAKRGLNQKEINDLAQQGLTALPFVEQLVKANNGKIHDLNHLDRVINSNSKALGAKVAGDTYNPQLATLAAKLEGLRGDVRHVGRDVVDAEHRIKRHHQTKTKNRTSTR